MKKLVRSLAVLPVLAALSSTPALAQRAEGWTFFKPGDLAISPMNLGPAITTGDFSRTSFGLFTDFDYHITANAAIGALLNFNFGDGTALQLGPQFKWKFKIGNTGHVPYLRFALPFQILFPPGGADTGFAMGVVQFGGGYRYWFHRMVGAGIDLQFIPAIILSDVGGASRFAFAINISFGVEIKL